jgi:protein arginine kinase activator
MICDKCKKNAATVHMQQFIGGHKTELHLCQECSFKMEMPISFENIFQGFLSSLQSIAVNPNRPAKQPAGPCERCGMTYEQFKAVGKLGCEACYQAFAKEIVALFKNVQGSTRHEGKFPQRLGIDLRARREADQLRSLLKQAVDGENYEEAVRLRDRLRALEPPKETNGKVQP